VINRERKRDGDGPVSSISPSQPPCPADPHSNVFRSDYGQRRVHPNYQSRPMAARYIELLRKALLNETCLEAEVAYFYARSCATGDKEFEASLAYDVRATLPDLYEQVAEARRIGRHLDRDLRKVGFSATMIGRRRMENLESCITDVVDHDVPGDLIECGVWRGGATIFMRGVLEALDEHDRLVWVADSFAGLPAPSRRRREANLSADKFPQLAVDIATVKANFARFDLLDERVRFLEGWFKDTLPSAPIESLSVLRLDGDYYDSTLDPLNSLYDKVSVGGYIIIDDYSLIPSCRAAVDKFRKRRGIRTPLEPVDADCVFWKKSADGS